jgi:drug/metabolite transporter (DMT)-like permease
MTPNAQSTPSSPTPIHPAHASNVFAALFWMAVALCSFTLVAISGREAGRGVDTLHIMFYRSAIAFALMIVIVALSRGGLPQIATRRLATHGLRNAIHFIAQYSWFSALMLIPLSQLIAIEFTAPLWVALLAPILLAERLTLPRILAAIIGFVGIILIVRPGSVPITQGTLLAITAAVGFAGAMITTKTLVRTESVLSILFHMAWMQLLASVVLIYPNLTVPTPHIFGWIIVVAIASMMAHYALSSAFSHADVITVAPMDFLRLPLITMVGAILYNERLDKTVLIGAAIVIIANFINVFGERLRQPRP